jgi:NADH-quinone oxidoreductase subunit N
MEIPIPNLDLMVIAPELVVLLTALLVMVLDLFLPKEQKGRLAWLSLVGVVAAGALSYSLWGSRGAELQDMLAADGYGLFLNLVILATAALAILFSVNYVGQIGLAEGEYYTLLLLSATGMMLMAAAINFMTIFLALEILSIALYVLVGLNRADQRSGEAALKYFLLGAFATGFLLYGMALVYGQAGTTSLAGVRDYVLSLNSFPALLTAGLGLMIVGFGFKVALVPFQMWTPDVYQGAPTSVTAFMSVGAKTAGFAALGRVVIYAFGNVQGQWVWVLGVLAALTMTVGNLAALRQTSLKRMLAYSSIAHAGYILVGLAAANSLGIGGVLFYLFSYAFMNVAAFAVVLAVERLGPAAGGGETTEDFAGLAYRKPVLAVAMAIFMFSLAGVPPLAGFLGKLYVFSAAIQARLTWLAIFGVLNSVVSAYYYLRVVVTMWMREEASEEAGRARVSPALQVGVGLSAAATVALGLWSAPVFGLALGAVVGLLGG